ncbi:ATP-binding protein [Plasticicumulans acidivorans]|uniref:histidine kinase n=1 Tax=Plasticicumulans acidivorans TaxID=886464 RepID=A0A317MSF2_9GAMM|nr:ATP-binding protein [Plasticicumulans acidivorans]PWV59058.1 signal transduction histidine kinase [Plasticicumulans acidivorans]
MTSLESRLSRGLILTLALLALLGFGLAHYSINRLTNEFIVGRLEHDLDALLADLELDASGHPQLASDSLKPVFEQPYSGHYFKISAPGGELRSRSLWDADFPLPEPSGNGIASLEVPGPDRQELLVIARRVRFGDESVTVGVTEDLSAFHTGLRTLTASLSGLALAAFGGLLLWQRLLIRRGLAPLEWVRRDLQQLGEGRIERLPTEVPQELRPLVDEINRLGTLVAQRLQRSRNALGNLAHALKTPLAVLTQLERHPALSEHAHLRDELTRRTQEIDRLLRRELKRARIAGSATPGMRVDLEREIDALVAVLERIHAERRLSFGTRIAAQSAPIDRDDLLELLGNLMDNACQWAHSRVLVSAAEADGELVLTVEDDGPGVADEQLALLGQRGKRLDESRAGSGLGLAIAQDIVDSYAGRLQLGRSTTLGGFSAQIRLPLAASH